MFMARKMMLPTDRDEKEAVSEVVEKQASNESVKNAELKKDTPLQSSEFADDSLTKLENTVAKIEELQRKEKKVEESLANEYADASQLDDVRNKAYDVFKRCKELENEYDWTTMKKKKASSDSTFWSIKFLLERYAECMQLCDVYLKSASTGSEDSKKITNIYAKVESNVNHVTQWFSNLNPEERMEQIGKKDEISMEQMDNMIGQVNEIKYLPDEYKDSIISPLNETKKELKEGFFRIVDRTGIRLLGGAIGSVIGVFLFFCIISYFLWSWIGWIIVFGYLHGVYSKFKHLNGYNNYFKANVSIIKLFLASVSI